MRGQRPWRGEIVRLRYHGVVKRRAVLLAVLLASCGKPAPPPPPPAPAPATLAPVLTREIVMAYVASLLDPELPKPEVGTAPSTDAALESLARSDLFAKKYGFRDFADYAEARRRVMLARLAWMKRQLAKTSSGTLEIQIRMASDTLLNPDATEEQRKEATQSLNRAMELKKALEAPSASSVVAEGDIALVAEFADQISKAEEAAVKK